MTTTPDQHLQYVITTWPQLTELLTTRNADTWPPNNKAEYTKRLDEHDAAEVAADRHAQRLATIRHESGQLYYTCTECGHAGDGHQHPVRIDRAEDGLGERPVPLRLHVLDTMRTVTIAVTAVADQIAAEVQRAPITSNRPSKLDPRTMEIERLAALDARDPLRWRHNRPADDSPVAAARWLLARLREEKGPCEPLRGHHRQRIASVAAEAARRIARVLGSERRHDPMPRPCPWSTGILTLHHGGTEPEQVTCEHGHDCAAPVPVVDGRRTWSGPELVELETALAAADRRASRAAAKRRQRAAKNTVA
ncbi:hypothetical protein [Streptomyces odonnellii]|uniref:hypothetical protein n=1 Tax=Streptomyces odonnellii TaxID=1417980 RepID=UPI0006267CEA|nr:hypothetical protein [Streptomyces odonnellii]